MNGSANTIARSWLRLSAATAGIAIALWLGQGVALAEEGTHAPSTGHQRATQAAAHAATTVVAADADSASRTGSMAAGPLKKTKAAAAASSADVISAVTPTRHAPGRTGSAAQGRATRAAMAKSVPSAAVITPADVAPRTGIPKTALSTHTGPAQSVQHFLAAAANWLSTLPANPITDVLQGALWAIRRTLFPASVGVITAPIKVPLYLTNTSTDSGAPKLGIYVSLGYGGTPQLFEFDTGAAGFYAAAASADPSASPWWGSGVTTTSQTVTDKFDSGLVYTGYAATGTVSLFASAGSTTPLVTTATATVGQIDNIDRVPPQGGDEVALWTPDGAVNGVPPIDGAFYGDFGMAPTYQSDGIANLINQLTFARGVTPGFRIHTDPSTGESWMQIGLTAADLQEPTGMFFAMVADPKAPQGATAPHSGVGYYSLQLMQATITIVNKAGTTVVSDANVGITPDTGASTTLHNTDNSPSSKEYDDKLIEWKNTDDTVGRIRSDHTFSLSGTTTGGSAVTFFDFPTTDVVDAGKIDVQNDSEKKDTYYLNTGISLFYDYDVVYAMGTSQGGGTLGLIPRSPQAL